MIKSFEWKRDEAGPFLLINNIYAIDIGRINKIKFIEFKELDVFGLDGKIFDTQELAVEALNNFLDKYMKLKVFI